MWACRYSLRYWFPLDKNKKIVGKNDLVSAFREYGYKSSDYKKFIEEMSKYREAFEMLCQ